MVENGDGGWSGGMRWVRMGEQDKGIWQRDGNVVEGGDWVEMRGEDGGEVEGWGWGGSWGVTCMAG